VILKLKAVPAVALDGTLSERETDEDGLVTLIELEVPVIEGVAVSFAVVGNHVIRGIKCRYGEVEDRTSDDISRSRD
jgi:hypothetical protein